METLKTVLVFSTIVLALKTQAVEAKKIGKKTLTTIWTMDINETKKSIFFDFLF